MREFPVIIIPGPGARFVSVEDTYTINDLIKAVEKKHRIDLSDRAISFDGNDPIPRDQFDTYTIGRHGESYATKATKGN